MQTLEQQITQQAHGLPESAQRDEENTLPGFGMWADYQHKIT